MSLVIPPPKHLRVEDMPCIHPNAAGMDIGARAIVVAVPPERDTEPVRVFETFTPDLHTLADWLVQCGIDTVAMESTGVYWVPVFELLERKRSQGASIEGTASPRSVEADILDIFCYRYAPTQ